MIGNPFEQAGDWSRRSGDHDRRLAAEHVPEACGICAEQAFGPVMMAAEILRHNAAMRVFASDLDQARPP